MEATSELLEAKFQKAESDLNHLTRKLELQCQDRAQGDSRKNPLELLRKVNAVKDEYKTLVKEAAEIQKAQSEAMEFFRTQFPLVQQALQQLQTRVGMEGTEEDKEKVAELEGLLGLEPSATYELQSDLSAPASAPAHPQCAGEANTLPHPATPQLDSQKSAASDNYQSVSLPCEDPVGERAIFRKTCQEFVEVSQEEFMSVSELVRGRVKLNEVNVVYRALYTHFREKKNSDGLLVSDMHKMGMRVTGATGQAKLKGTEEDKEKVAELEGLLGLEPSATYELQSDLSAPASAPAHPQCAGEANTLPHPATPQLDSQKSAASDNYQSVSLPCEDPVGERAIFRKTCQEFVEVSQEEFMSVSELVRGRVKLNEVNVVYRALYTHFREKKNSDGLLVSDMHKMGMRVTGATGQAKLKVLRALKLLTISSKGEVKFQ